MRILITGGCGFVGSNLAIDLKRRHPAYQIYAFDNLRRRGSELAISRLKANKIHFIHGDIRIANDLFSVPKTDLVIDAAAEPAVMSGISGSLRYTIDTNLVGTINTLDYALESKAAVIFLSTSRVYPYDALNELRSRQISSRFVLSEKQPAPGISSKGVGENFGMEGPKTPYGATKYASELLIDEYQSFRGLKAVVNRCGVIAGPWQMGKVDQGFMVYWITRHIWKKKLKYIGFGGTGKQVRDVLHVEDLGRLIDWQIDHLDQVNGHTLNVGGGYENSVSLKELTRLAAEKTGNVLKVGSEPETRPGDVKIYYTDNSKVRRLTKWKPQISIPAIVEDVATWIHKEQGMIKPILS